MRESLRIIVGAIGQIDLDQNQVKNEPRSRPVTIEISVCGSFQRIQSAFPPLEILEAFFFIAAEDVPALAVQFVVNIVKERVRVDSGYAKLLARRSEDLLERRCS